MKNSFVLLITFVFAACVNEVFYEPEEVADNRDFVSLPEQQYEQGYLRLLLTEALSKEMEKAALSGTSSTKAISAEESLSDINVTSIKRTFPYAGRFEERTRKSGLHLWYDVEFDRKVDLNRARQVFSTVRGVKKIEYRPLVARYWNEEVLEYVQKKADEISNTSYAIPFNDPELPKQWHLNNDGSLGSNYISGADVNVFDAWNYTTGSSDVIVAVIDGGIDYLHEDLADNMWQNYPEKNGTSSLDDDKNGYKDDIHGYNFVSDIGKLVPHNHGTHVAGVIAAVNNNGKGVSGIAGGNGKSVAGVRLMSCQIFVSEDDPYAGNAGRKGATAIKYAADNGAVICQNSWGYPNLSETPASDKAAIDYFVEYAGIDEKGKQTGAMRGGLVVFAAGNENRTAAAPASYEKVVAVSSIAPDYKKAYYSNYGEWIDLAAPGGDVQRYGNKGTVLSTVVDGYGYMQGTSMACPHVSGVAALVLSHYKRSGYNAAMLRARLENAAKEIDSYNASYKNKLGLLINAHSALAYGSTRPPNAVSNLTASVHSNVVKLTWTIPIDPDDGKASGFNVYYRKTPINGIDINTPPADVLINNFSTGTLAAGSTYEAEIKHLDFESTYYFVVNAFDFSGNFSELTTQISKTTLKNNPPEITPLDSIDIVMKAHQTAILNFWGEDPDGHEFFWSLDSAKNGIELIDLGTEKVQLTIKGTLFEPGLHNVKLNLEDEYGLQATSQLIEFDVLQNHAPEIVGSKSNVYIGGLNREYTFQLSDYFSDADNELLKYTIENTAPDLLHINANKGIIYMVSLAYGLSDVKITAEDAMGLTASLQFNVLIRDDNNIIDVYPNPVIDKLQLRTGSVQQCHLSIFNNAGALLFEKEMTIDPFSPEIIDMEGYSGGIYNLHFQIGDKKIIRQIIKL